MKLNYSLITGIEIEGIDHADAPDYCDAFIAQADYDGVPMSDAQLETLNEDRDFVYEQVMAKIY